jgi:hypothetical protein
MKKEWADKWAKALRSGKYKQGFGKLYNKDTKRYCCLGVLCKLTKNRMTGPKEYLSQKVMDQTGMPSKQGSVYPCGYNLSGLNDTGMSFNMIADIIEKEWENL